MCPIGKRLVRLVVLAIFVIAESMGGVLVSSEDGGSGDMNGTDVIANSGSGDVSTDDIGSGATWSVAPPMPSAPPDAAPPSPPASPPSPPQSPSPPSPPFPPTMPPPPGLPGAFEAIVFGVEKVVVPIGNTSDTSRRLSSIDWTQTELTALSVAVATELTVLSTALDAQANGMHCLSLNCTVPAEVVDAGVDGAAAGLAIVSAALATAALQVQRVWLVEIINDAMGPFAAAVSARLVQAGVDVEIHVSRLAMVVLQPPSACGEWRVFCPVSGGSDDDPWATWRIVLWSVGGVLIILVAVILYRQRKKKANDRPGGYATPVPSHSSSRRWRSKKSVAVMPAASDDLAPGASPGGKRRVPAPSD